MNRDICLQPEDIIATVQDLVSINSVNSNYPGGPGEEALAEYVAQFFKNNSIPYQEQLVSKGHCNVIGRLEGLPGGPTLVFEAHMDTVSELGMSIPPFGPMKKGNFLYGRGSCDMKAGLAAMLHAFKAVRNSGATPSATVLLAAVVDEEYSYTGVLKLLESGLQADGAIVGEPTELNTAIACKGALRWRLHVRGKKAHSSKPHLGINAIDKMGKLLVALQEKLPPLFESRSHPTLGPPTLNVGTIEGGVQANIVPDSCSILLDRRLLPGEAREQVWNEFEEVIGELRRVDPELSVDMDPPVLEDIALDTPPNARIVKVVEQVAGDVLGPRRLTGVSYGSDASKLARAGIPTLILGPGSIDRAHTADEYVEIDQVILAAEIYARTIQQF